MQLALLQNRAEIRIHLVLTFNRLEPNSFDRIAPKRESLLLVHQQLGFVSRTCAF